MGASNSRQALREAERKKEKLINDRLSLFTSLFHNSVKIVGDTTVPKRYLLRSLLHKGGIAYDKQTQLYLRYVGSMIDVYGLYSQYTLYGYNGVSFVRNAEDVVILRANDQEYPLISFLRNQVEKIVNIEMAIDQNLEAIKTMSIAECTDDTFLTSANYVESRRIGATIFYRNKNYTPGDSVIKVDSTGAQYLVDKLFEARQKLINETLSALSISTANTDKRERVQSAEILASEGFAIEMGKTLIDTFNYDAKVGGIPIRLESNSELQFENKIDNKIKEKEATENENISAE